MQQGVLGLQPCLHAYMLHIHMGADWHTRCRMRRSRAVRYCAMTAAAGLPSWRCCPRLQQRRGCLRLGPARSCQSRCLRLAAMTRAGIASGADKVVCQDSCTKLHRFDP
jgi:hypothetical protein